MDIGDATAIFFTTPIWVGILARIILKETFTVIDLFGSILGLIGIILIAKPGFLFTDVSSSRNTSLLWAGLDLGLAIIGGLSYVCVRAAGENVDPIKFVLYTAITELMIGLSTIPVMEQPFVLPPCNWIRGALVACGIGATVAHLLLVKGLSLENSGPASLMRNWDTVFAYIFQVTIFKVTPDVLSIVGSLLVVNTVIFQGIDKLFDISCGIAF